MQRGLKRKRNGKQKKASGPSVPGSKFYTEPTTKTLVMRCSFTQNIGANAAGNIAVNNNIGTENVFNVPFDGFASAAALFQEYRVRSLGLRIIRGYTSCPAYVSSIVGGATATVPFGTVAFLANDYFMVGKTQGAFAPSTIAQVRQLDGLSILPVFGDRVETFSLDWRDFPNAKLWSDTTAVIPTVNQMGYVIAGSGAGALANGQTDVLLIYSYAIVEFRTRL